jgi:hypothetical protein
LHLIDRRPHITSSSMLNLQLQTLSVAVSPAVLRLRLVDSRVGCCPAVAAPASLKVSRIKNSESATKDEQGGRSVYVCDPIACAVPSSWPGIRIVGYVLKSSQKRKTSLRQSVEQRKPKRENHNKMSASATRKRSDAAAVVVGQRDRAERQPREMWLPRLRQSLRQ